MKFCSIERNHSRSGIFKTLGILKILTTKAFGPKPFSSDGSQGIRIDGKHGGFVEPTWPRETQSDRLSDPQLFSFLQGLELLISSGFTHQLLRSCQL